MLAKANMKKKSNLHAEWVHLQTLAIKIADQRSQIDVTGLIQGSLRILGPMLYMTREKYTTTQNRSLLK